MLAYLLDLTIECLNILVDEVVQDLFIKAIPQLLDIDVEKSSLKWNFLDSRHGLICLLLQILDKLID